jgi:hypothetical protein
MDGPQPINHRHADFQSDIGRLLAIYFNKLSGRPWPDLHYRHNTARLTHANITRRMHRV